MCTEWNNIISGFRQLARKRNQLDVQEKILFKKSIEIRHSKQKDLTIDICCAIDENSILVCDSEHGIACVLNGKGEVISDLDIMPGEKPLKIRGICTFGGRIFIMDSINRQIQIFNSDYSLNSIIKVKEFQPASICCSRDQNIILVTSLWRVAILDPNGKRITTFGSHGPAKEQFRFAVGIACNSRDEIIVLDVIESEVKFFDQRGNLVRVFGSLGSKPRQFILPSGICTDEDDNILVVDAGNNRVCIFTPESFPIQQIPTREKPLNSCTVGRSIVVVNGDQFIDIFSNL